MLAIVIVAALGFVGVIGYILYLTPGPKDQI
jgi:preprotein translocase subunit Sss1